MFRTAATVAFSLALIATGLVSMFMPSQILPPTIDAASVAASTPVTVRHPRNFTPVVTSDGKVRAIAYGDLDLAATKLSPVGAVGAAKPAALAQQTYDPSTTTVDSAAALAVATSPAPTSGRSAGLPVTGLAWGLMIIGLSLVGAAFRGRRRDLVVVA